MKAAANGALNMSVLDGWWCEAYDTTNGWVIGSGEEYDNPDYQDEVESKAIYDLLEKDIVPMFYERGQDGLPRTWVNRVKKSMTAICPNFNTNRMIEEYTKKFYNTANAHYYSLIDNNFEKAKKLADWKKRISDNWAKIKIAHVEDNVANDINLGNNFNIRVKVQLCDNIKPDDVCVQIYAGYLDSKGHIIEPVIEKMNLAEQSQDGSYSYEGAVMTDRIGHCGYVVRVLPQLEGKVFYIPKLITWQ
jgi:starch phosphorylase